jgi:hypothetical protein
VRTQCDQLNALRKRQTPLSTATFRQKSLNTPTPPRL